MQQRDNYLRSADHVRQMRGHVRQSVVECIFAATRLRLDAHMAAGAFRCFTQLAAGFTNNATMYAKSAGYVRKMRGHVRQTDSPVYICDESSLKLDA